MHTYMSYPLTHDNVSTHQGHHNEILLHTGTARFCEEYKNESEIDSTLWVI